MSLITNQNAESPQVDTSGQVNDVKPVDRVDPMQSDQFTDLMARDETKKAMEQNAAEDGAISPEELQRQIQENLFKSGFNRAMEKAKEISKELKEG